MRKLKLFTAVLTAVLMSAAANALAYSDLGNIPSEKKAGFYTVVTDTEGETHIIDGIIDADCAEKSDAIEKIASYEIFMGNESVMNVTLNDIISENSLKLMDDKLNGYYTADFVVSQEDNTEAFLTGLSKSNLALVQEAIVGAKAEDRDIKLESLDFIDAEKKGVENGGDDLLCWAATASNMLHYTGWGKKAGFDTNDDLLDLFNDSFTDNAAHTNRGIEWFFNKYYQDQNSSGAQVKDYGNSGGYLEKYCAALNVEYVAVNHDQNMDKVLNRLRNGWGMGLLINWVNEEGERSDSAHAITVWGYICDNDYEVSDAEYIKALFVTDSDSDRSQNENRRIAPNKLSLQWLQPLKDSWKFTYYGGLIEGFYTLKPYSDDIEYETDADATLNPVTNVDLIATGAIVSNDGFDSNEGQKVFAEESSVYVIPKVKNYSEPDFNGVLNYSVSIYENEKEIGVYNGTYEGVIDKQDNNYIAGNSYVEIKNLKEGNYRAVVNVNSDKAISEAFYYNNQFTYEFTVVKSEIDLSGASISAQICEVEENNTQMQAKMSYNGIETVIEEMGSDAQCKLMMSYYSNGKWRAWETAISVDEPAAGGIPLSSEELIESCGVYRGGSKVKFRLRISAPDKPEINIYSDEYELECSIINVKPAEQCTESFSPLPARATAFMEGEVAAFTLTNNSNENVGALKCEAVVYGGIAEYGIELFRTGEITLALGETSQVFSFSSWDSELEGTTELNIVVFCNGVQVEAYSLGLLKVHEQGFEVTLMEDITNPYDGCISLREAVEYYTQYADKDDVITFAQDISGMIELTKPLVIDSYVRIDGERNMELDYPSGIMINGNLKTQLFKVTENGTLDMSYILCFDAISTEYGGAIENRGGNVMLRQCRVGNCTSGYAGGGIYTYGGNVSIKNCMFEENTSGYGGALCIDGGAAVDMISSNFIMNKSNSGAVYVNNGALTGVYSTFTDNTAGSSGSCDVTLLSGSADMVGCILPADKSVSENVSVYGSFTNDKNDNLNVSGQTTEIFKYSFDGKTRWDNNFFLNQTMSFPQLSSVINNGVFVKNLDGKIACSSDGEKWIETGAKSAFTDEEYSHDMCGNEHGALFGSYAVVNMNTEIMRCFSGGINVYTPAALEAVMIVKIFGDDGNIKSIKIHDCKFNAGTNNVELGDDEKQDNTEFMLWDSLGGMKPICRTAR